MLNLKVHSLLSCLIVFPCYIFISLARRDIRRGHDILDSEVSDIENEDSEDEPKAAKHKTAGKKAGAGAGKRGKRKGVAKNAEKRKEVRIEWSAHRTKGAVEHPFGIESGKSGYQKRSADVNKSPVIFFLAFITDAIRRIVMFVRKIKNGGLI